MKGADMDGLFGLGCLVWYRLFYLVSGVSEETKRVTWSWGTTNGVA